MNSKSISSETTGHAHAEINKKADALMSIALWTYFAIGIGLSVFYSTYMTGFGVGALCLIGYYVTKLLLPGSSLHRYLLSVIFGIFPALFIYQMHGLFEMHFFFFAGSALLIAYQNWKLQIPLLGFIVIHHSTFAYLQYSGMKEMYFTQLDSMDIQTFLFHAVIAAIIVFINAMLSYRLEKRTLQETKIKDDLALQSKNIRENILFAEAISQGNLNLDLTVSTDNNELGQSLLKMRNSLMESSSREKAEKFIAEGIATVGEILRKHADDPEKLSDDLISTIVKYTSSNQGALFVTAQDEKEVEYLNLIACYAYDRKKFMQKRIEIGDHIVGQCFMEKEVIHLTNVPKDYVKITSGLGLATPSSVIIIPLITNEEVKGVIELASFNTYDAANIEFLKKASTAIATALISLSTTERIKKLLTESQQRTEELRAQEEEMRQNMEELSATQEEMQRNTTEMESRVQAINESGIASIEFQLDGTIITANTAFLNLMGYSLSEVQGKHHRIFVDRVQAESSDYTQFWKDLATGIAKPGEYARKTKNGSTVYIQGSYSVIRDKNGNPQRVLKLASDVTKSKMQQEEAFRNKSEMESRVRAIDESGIASIEFYLDGTIIAANTAFLNLMGYSLSEIQGRHHRIFVDKAQAESSDYAQFWKDLAAGIAKPGEYARKTKNGSTVYIQGSYSVIRDTNGNPQRVLKLANDITKSKMLAIEAERSNNKKAEQLV